MQLREELSRTRMPVPSQYLEEVAGMVEEWEHPSDVPPLETEMLGGGGGWGGGGGGGLLLLSVGKPKK
ncbi:hypothetical protein [Allostreptomyces psammosilenae]|uniref:Uncharacterized protein n=1 Tax=Allostreptomyces psammosilenae TaxID=1892865 RepID=A0A852ZSK1_9ACTN|nr:hypothetical protein [Allostreptomyces psammosilenae]NYI04805.1 hypothetical protein [Allostreptomyces psammosilenae]